MSKSLLGLRNPLSLFSSYSNWALRMTSAKHDFETIALALGADPRRRLHSSLPGGNRKPLWISERWQVVLCYSRLDKCILDFDADVALRGRWEGCTVSLVSKLLAPSQVLIIS